MAIGILELKTVVNLLGHEVKVSAFDGSASPYGAPAVGWMVWGTIPATEEVARVLDGQIVGLPPKKRWSDLKYLVSPEVAALCLERDDIWIEDNEPTLPSGAWTRHRGIRALDQEQVRHDLFMGYLRSRTPEQVRRIAIEAGIIDEHGQLTPPYRDD